MSVDGLEDDEKITWVPLEAGRVKVDAVELVAGVTSPGEYPVAGWEEVVGKTVSGVGWCNTEGAYGLESVMVVFFTDGTVSGVVVASDDD